MTILVLGATGQLASHLRDELPSATFWGRATLDLGVTNGIKTAIVDFAPQTIINAAAYTAVDKAETERTLAWTINAEAPARIAEAASVLGASLIHVSTDYVFDGTKRGEYAVDDAVRPASVYGASKLAGELAVRALCPRSWVLRTSWVFSEHGQNFVRTILRLAATRDSLRVVADQVGRPTYAKHLARAIAHTVMRAERGGPESFGVYHATGGPIVSWFEFATAIVDRAHALRLLERRTPISAITTAEYPTAARRPANSALLPSADWAAAVGASFDWASGLDEVLRKIAG